MPALVFLVLLIACSPQPTPEPHFKYGLTSHIHLDDAQWAEYSAMRDCRQTSANWWRCEGGDTWGETWIDSLTNEKSE